jgi:amidase
MMSECGRRAVNEVIYATAWKLTQAIAQREVSTSEVVEAHLEQITTHNPALNAVITLDPEVALARARAADEALFRRDNDPTKQAL